MKKKRFYVEGLKEGKWYSLGVVDAFDNYEAKMKGAAIYGKVYSSYRVKET